MTDSELKKFPYHVFGQSFTTLKCQASLYLPWMEKKIKQKGGKILTGKIDNVWDLHGKYDVVVNCTGLGSRDLFDDLLVYPIRGQVVQVSAPWLTHFIRDGDGSTYIYPGINSTTLGGTRDKDDWRMSPDGQTSKQILDRCCAIEPSLQSVKGFHEKVGLRPARAAVRLEKVILVKNGQHLPVVHNYGHGGGGFSVHIGTAKAATRLVEELIPSLKATCTKSKL
ncbi:D-aspartate oxidase isoform X2 [Bombina bombina]|nr:D-aspartate oxidase isoform X2 [Bombina bombina]XP_053566831.1 D-aspartate oxidase isoform X2 [Bombina bombina]